MDASIQELIDQWSVEKQAFYYAEVAAFKKFKELENKQDGSCGFAYVEILDTKSTFAKTYGTTFSPKDFHNHIRTQSEWKKYEIALVIVKELAKFGIESFAHSRMD